MITRLYALEESYGCSGSRLDAYLLSPPALSRADLLSLWSSLPDEAEKPSLPAPSWDSSWPTRGAFEDALAAHYAAEAAMREEAEKALSATRITLLKAQGVTPVIPLRDHSFPATSLTREHGCRCSWGHTRPEEETSPLFTLERLSPTHLLLSEEVKDARVLLEDALTEVAPEVRSFARERARALSFSPLSHTEERALSPTDWEAYRAHATLLTSPEARERFFLTPEEHALSLAAALLPREVHLLREGLLPEEEW